MKRTLVLILCLALGSASFSQTLKSSKDGLTNISTVQYYNQEAQFIIQKVNDPSSSKPTYLIGLIVFRNSVSSDEFMKVGGGIVFEDDSRLIFADQVSLNYLYSGKHQLSIRHQLTDEELQQLKTKRIKHFKVANYLKEVDRFEKDKILDAFSKIESE